jgi:hypothetical protein
MSGIVRRSLMNITISEIMKNCICAFIPDVYTRAAVNNKAEILDYLKSQEIRGVADAGFEWGISYEYSDPDFQFCWDTEWIRKFEEYNAKMNPAFEAFVRKEIGEF